MGRILKKFFKKIKTSFFLTKRGKFVLIVLILTMGLLVVQLVSTFPRYSLIGALAFLSYFLTAWGLREDLKGVEWLTLFILPVMFVLAISLFYFLLPIRWLTRLPTAIVFAIGFYAILLVENIYNVAAEKTIQLLRVGYSVGLLLTLTTVFLFSSTIFSLHLPYYWNTLLIFLIFFPLVLQCLWAVKLESKIDREIVIYTLVISLGAGELAFIFSFWPIGGVLEALFLTTFFYCSVGMFQQYLLGRLFEKTKKEFFFVLVFVFILIFFATSWG